MFGRKQFMIYALRLRVLELEKRLCPDGHEWVDTGAREYFYDGLQVDAMIQYECKKCGKVKTGFRWEGE